MEISAATRSSPGTPNDDTFITGANFAAVLDGATAPVNRDTGCVHDVPWLVAHLAAHLAAALTRDSDAPLDRLLAEAIRLVRDDHADTCDLSNPDSPSSTVTILRRRAETLDFLVLGDSPLVFEGRDGDVEAIVDDRVEHLSAYDPDSVSRLRNNPEGFWVASTDPLAARQALRGGRPVDAVARALLVTDGTSRLVERYGHGWPQVLRRAEKAGPRALVSDVHAADALVETVRGKRFDDATAVLCRLSE